MFLGVDDNSQLLYEGSSTGNGHGLWPAPFLSPALVNGTDPSGSKSLPGGPDHNGYKLLFREDSFDPVTRLRRGRLYRTESRKTWYTTVHPLGDPQAGGIQKVAALVLNKDLMSYSSTHPRELFAKHPIVPYFIDLGFQMSFTRWRLINIENISTGEELLTLKATSFLGSLPELIDEQIPDAYRNAIRERMERLSNVFGIGDSTTIIDLCRALASHVMIARNLEFDGNYKPKELADAADWFESKNSDKALYKIPNCARILARLHTEHKPISEITGQFRLLTEQDANLALNCVSTILCDLNWAKWI